MKNEKDVPYEEQRSAQLEDLYNQALALKDLQLPAFGEAKVGVGPEDVFRLVIMDYAINLQGPKAILKNESYYRTNVDSIFLKMWNSQRALLKFGVLKLRSLNLVFK